MSLRFRGMGFGTGSLLIALAVVPSPGGAQEANLEPAAPSVCVAACREARLSCRRECATAVRDGLHEPEGREEFEACAEGCEATFATCGAACEPGADSEAR